MNMVTGQPHPSPASDCAASCTLLLMLLFGGITVAQAGSVPTMATLTIQGSSASQPAQDPDEARLAKEKLKLEVEKLSIENANAQRTLTTTKGWMNLLYGNGSVIVAIVLGFVGLLRYLKERREELLKREDERFEEVVKGLGSEHDQERVSSAVLLPTFLRKGYRRFYMQVFNLAAGNLGARTSTDSASIHADPRLRSKGSPSSSLTQALTGVLRESYPRARDTLKLEPRRMGREVGRYLNASGVHLEGAYLEGADLRHAWLRNASFRGATLVGVDLAGANLQGCKFTNANLGEAILDGANLNEADFTDAVLEYANLSGAGADVASFARANLKHIIMEKGILSGANFSGADLSAAKFSGTIFAVENGKPANLETSERLTGAVFENVKGLTFEQIAQCKKMGAKFESAPA